MQARRRSRQLALAALAVALGGAGAAAAQEAQGGEGGKDQRRLMVIEKMGARTFGGTRVPMPDDPTECIGEVCSEPTTFLYCDHGYVDWQIPNGARPHPLVFTHGSGIRAYQTTFAGRPGFQTIFLKRRYPLYLVDLPRTGRAGQACEEYTYDGPVHLGWSSKFVFSNRLGIPAPPGVEDGEFFPGVAFSQDPKALEQYYRVQYHEFNGEAAEARETDALAVLMEEIYKEHGKGGIVFAHSSGASRGPLLALKTDKVGGLVLQEACGQRFPQGEAPPPLVRADGTPVPYEGPFVSEEEFLKFTKFPILILWGDNIPREPDPANSSGYGLNLDNRRISLERCGQWADAINARGGHATNLRLPDVGVFGNTHYVMSDENVKDVADVVSKWLRQEGLDK